MNITELFLAAAKSYPDKPAIISNKAEISYARLEEEVLQTAAYFQAKGLKPGDRVLVFVPMSIDLYRIVLALFYSGATAVFLDEWISVERLKVCCRLADCKAFVGVPKARILGWFLKDIRRIPLKLALKGKLKTSTPMQDLDEEASALITFTTGSSGTPKAADRSHAFLKHQFNALKLEIDPKVEDVDMPVLPIVLFMNLGMGCTSVIAKFNAKKAEQLNGQVIQAQIDRHKVNRITASPFFIKRLADSALGSKHSYKSIEKVFTGGAPVFPSEAQLYQKAFPNAAINIVYGSTEAEPISSISASELSQSPANLPDGLPVGQPFSKTELRIIEIKAEAISVASENELEQLEIAEGEIGEIIVAGDHVLKSYFQNDAAFKRNKIKTNTRLWHRTGDSGRMLNNRLYLTGPCKELIPLDKSYISTFLMEYQLEQIPGIDRGTLILHQQQKVLLLETKLRETQLQAALKDLDYDRFKSLEKIPRDPRHNSKIDYAKLRTMLD